jgi:hypothetical protein
LIAEPKPIPQGHIGSFAPDGQHLAIELLKLSAASTLPMCPTAAARRW